MTRLKRKAKKRRQRPAGGGEQGLPPEGGATRAPAARESVEDPLEDWAADDAETDRWVLEREGEDVQRGDG
jgi:hypothetical protein